MKILTIIGARPQFVKAATVSRVIETMDDVEEIIVHTGQHYDDNMSKVFFDELNIPKPHYNLSIGSFSHGAQTGRMLEKIEEVLEEEKPDWVLIYGDTNSTLAGALAAVKLHIPVAHVEAGLRSFNRQMPEEINRIVADSVSTLLFAPTDQAIKNLKNEGVADEKISLSGDVMLDASMYYSKQMEGKNDVLETLGLASGQYALATVHRAENTDSLTALKNICSGLKKLSEDMPVVLPLHPRTRAVIDKEGMLQALDGIILTDPATYLDMVVLERSAKLIVTDSGGVQKEAYFFGVPCITLRSETEWVELVASGWNVLLNPHEQDLVEVLPSAAKRETPSNADSNIYGNGHAAENIVKSILEYK